MYILANNSIVSNCYRFLVPCNQLVITLSNEYNYINTSNDTDCITIKKDREASLT